MKWEMEIDEVEAVLEKIWDLHDKLSDAIHSISRAHFLNSVTAQRKSDKKKLCVNEAISYENRGGLVYMKDFRAADDDNSAIQEAKSLNSIRTALENLEDQLEFFYVSWEFIFGFEFFYVSWEFTFGFEFFQVLIL